MLLLFYLISLEIVIKLFTLALIDVWLLNNI